MASNGVWKTPTALPGSNTTGCRVSRAGLKSGSRRPPGSAPRWSRGFCSPTSLVEPTVSLKTTHSSTGLTLCVSLPRVVRDRADDPSFRRTFTSTDRTPEATTSRSRRRCDIGRDRVVVEAGGRRLGLAHRVSADIDGDRAGRAAVADGRCISGDRAADLEGKAAAIAGRDEPLHDRDRALASPRVAGGGDVCSLSATRSSCPRRTRPGRHRRGGPARTSRAAAGLAGSGRPEGGSLAGGSTDDAFGLS